MLTRLTEQSHINISLPMLALSIVLDVNETNLSRYFAWPTPEPMPSARLPQASTSNIESTQSCVSLTISTPRYPPIPSL